ncbi:EDD domain protein, DegV family [Anaerocolumna jejuensis DSM 15929]|uniref:EDD domain protein, DegV family n=1 Tax=Anaerocolumna jejuensis DSM 15929 TaxID=1121322 RepID=A0A1M6MA64_9FIRM|nr:DegV family protein [Anaerocolumna jejuensis]SHJ80398.1 EDD domain protein, DegV family [Anaerocolumna jejuensis DSM 15929]
MSYKIIGDSCTDLTEEMRKDGHFHIVPLTLQVGEDSIVDDRTFNQARFLKLVSESPVAPKSSCPSPDAYMELFKGEEDIYVITLSSNLSGSFNSAEVAKKLYLEENPHKNIEVINSCSASVGQTLIALKIQEFAGMGLGFKEITERVRKFRESLSTKFVLENLDTLRKSGRLTGLKAIISSVLNIKPVMYGTPEGTINKLDQARGIQKALGIMVDSVEKDVKNPEERIFAIAHCNNAERAKFVREEILKRVSFKDCIIVDTAGVSTMYAGDGGIIISY